MRKTLAIALAAILPISAMAMPGAERPHRGGNHPDGLVAHMLQSDANKRAELHQLQREYRQSRNAIPKRYLEKLPTAEQQAMQDEIKALDAKHQQDIRALLTPEQIKQLDDYQQQREARRAERAEFAQWKKEREASGKN